MELKAVDLRKDFPRNGKSGSTFTAVQPLNLELKRGKLIEITGRSGSGKSTLLNLFAGLLTPTSGKVFLDDTDLYSLGEEERARLRNENIGLIPQGHTALQALTVLENVLLPAVLYRKEPPPEARAKELLEQVGVADLMQAKPGELSGGELRRMAVARALLMHPGVLLADEPTGDLDDENTHTVLSLLQGAAHDGAAVLLVTHEAEAKAYADALYRMDNGTLMQEF